MTRSPRIFQLTLCVVLIFLASCRGSQEGHSSKLTVVRIPDTHFMGLLPAYAADQQGFFRREGIQVAWADIRDPGQAEKLYAVGKADVFLSTYANLLPREARATTKSAFLLAAFEDSSTGGSAILVPSSSTIRALQQLAGRRVGTYSGPSQRLYAEIALNRAGLEIENGTELMQVSTSSQLPALFSGTFDALFAVEPYISLGMHNGARILEDRVRTRYIHNPFAVGAAVASPRLPADVRLALARALASGIDFIDHSDAGARSLLAQRLNLVPSVAARMAFYRWTTEPSQADFQAIDAHISLLVDGGLLDERPTAAGLFRTP